MSLDDSGPFSIKQFINQLMQSSQRSSTSMAFSNTSLSLKDQTSLLSPTDHKNSPEMKHGYPNPVSNPKNRENLEEAKHDQKTLAVLKNSDVDQELLDIIEREG